MRILYTIIHAGINSDSSAFVCRPVFRILECARKISCVGTPWTSSALCRWWQIRIVSSRIIILRPSRWHVVIFSCFVFIFFLHFNATDSRGKKDKDSFTLIQLTFLHRSAYALVYVLGTVRWSLYTYNTCIIYNLENLEMLGPDGPLGRLPYYTGNFAARVCGLRDKFVTVIVVVTMF